MKFILSSWQKLLLELYCVTVIYNSVTKKGACGRNEWAGKKHTGADPYGGQSRIYGKGVPGRIPAEYCQNGRRDHRGILWVLWQQGRTVRSPGGTVLWIYDGTVPAGTWIFWKPAYGKAAGTDRKDVIRVYEWAAGIFLWTYGWILPDPEMLRGYEICIHDWWHGRTWSGVYP